MIKKDNCITVIISAAVILFASLILNCLPSKDQSGAYEKSNTRFLNYPAAEISVAMEYLPKDVHILKNDFYTDSCYFEIYFESTDQPTQTNNEFPMVSMDLKNRNLLTGFAKNKNNGCLVQGNQATVYYTGILPNNFKRIQNTDLKKNFELFLEKLETALVNLSNFNPKQRKNMINDKLNNSLANSEGDTLPENSDYVKRRPDNPEILIETAWPFGSMKLELFRDVAPAHADSMIARIKEGFYDQLTFHRIIDGFMIQGGDPAGTGMGGADYNLPAEFSDLPHREGTLSMARAQNINSASSQFFICLEQQRYLDNKYTVFGHVMEGLETLHEIGQVAVISSGREKSKPIWDVIITKMTVLKE